MVSPRPSRRSDGLTLLEVMFAIAILGTGMLAMLAMQTATMKHSRRGKEHTEAALIAQRQMETIQHLPYASPLVAPAGWNPGALVNGVVAGGAGGPVAPIVYTRQQRITATADPNMRMVDVRVTWADPNMPAGAPLKRYAISSAKYNDP